MKCVTAWGLFAANLLGTATVLVVTILHAAHSAKIAPTAALCFMALSFAAVGGLLSLRRPANGEGWLLLAVATAWSLPMASTAVGDSLVDHHAGGAAAAWLAWPGVWLWMPPLGLMGTQIQLRFPDGALPSPRWRWFSRLSLVLVALATIGIAIAAPRAPTAMKT